jgi:zinc/manganese transport system permease protein
MEQMLELMAAPFAACVVLVGIHAYLGMHVIQRKIIFVDLALAQIAALGATFGYLLGIGPHERGAYFFSLGFAIVGAALFAMTRMRHERIPQEAIIGIVYVVALASAILVADRAPEGAEHIKETLVGTILWVRWPTILKTAIIYGLVGLLHFALRARFLQISFHPERAYAESRYVRLWDFVFYVTFAFVITSSVAIAGVLVVFSFLVIPSVIATLFARTIAARLAVGWSVGILACLIGMVGSYRFDVPSGPSVVVSLGVALLLAGLLYSVLSAPKRRYALLKIFAGTVLIAGVLAGLSVFVTSGAFLHIAHEHEWEAPSPVEALPAERGQRREELTAACGEDADCLVRLVTAQPGWLREVASHLQSADPAEREWWIRLLEGVDDPGIRELLARSAADEPDLLLRIEILRRLAELQDRRGAAGALGLLEDDTPPLLRDEAYRLIVEFAGRDFGYDALASASENAEALDRMRVWLRD